MSIEGVKDVYPCDGSRTEFEITFPFASTREVTAFLSNKVTGERRRLIRNLDYTIRGTTLVLRNDDFREPWSADYDLCILSRARIEQGSSQAMSPDVFAKRVTQLTQMFSQIREQTLRTLHIGIQYPPLNLTSSPYAHLATDYLVATSLSVDNSYNPLTPSFISLPVAVVSGSLETPEINFDAYTYELLECNAIEVSSGTMLVPLVEYDAYTYELLECSLSAVLSGTMIAPLVAYDAYTYEMLECGAHSVVSGTMTT